MGAVKVSVYTQKQAEKYNGKWDKSHSATQREGFKLSDEQAKDLNKNFKANGRYYELDKKATDAYLSAIKDK